MTALSAGERVAKFDSRVTLNGELDELNACLGLAVVSLQKELPEWTEAIQKQQRLIVAVSGWVASREPEVPEALKSRIDDAVQKMEQSIDNMASVLPPLKAFVLPGGTESSVRLHLARTVCRRCERRFCQCFNNTGWNTGPILSWLNRMSDFLFMLARTALL